MSDDKPSTGVRSLAGAILDLLPVPDGETRETLLNLANPLRDKVKEIIDNAVPKEESGLRKLFKALDTFYVPDDEVAELARRGLDPNDVHTVTCKDKATRERLADLGGAEPNGEQLSAPTAVYDQDAEPGPFDYVTIEGDDEAEAVREFLASRRAEASKSETSKES